MTTNETTNRIEKIPGVKWALVHPRLAAWIVLSLGMVILLVIEARDVGLLVTQWIALIVACVLVAGACIWIISWEDDDEEASVVTTADTSTTPADPNTEL
jgi:hypothetical protein